MTVGRAYSIAAFWPSIISLIGVWIFSYQINKNYKSEWISSSGALEIDLIINLAISMVMLVLNLGIFLNHYTWFREDKLFHTLSWFLLPGCFLFISLSLFQGNFILEEHIIPLAAVLHSQLVAFSPIIITTVNKLNSLNISFSETGDMAIWQYLQSRIFSMFRHNFRLFSLKLAVFDPKAAKKAVK